MSRDVLGRGTGGHGCVLGAVAGLGPIVAGGHAHDQGLVRLGLRPLYELGAVKVDFGFVLDGLGERADVRLGGLHERCHDRRHGRHLGRDGRHDDLAVLGLANLDVGDRGHDGPDGGDLHFGCGRGVWI